MLKNSGLPALEGQILLARATGLSRVQLIARGNEPLEIDQLRAFQVLAKRRLEGEPLAYIVGEREFYGRRFEVGPGVLIPRPDTELLVERALSVCEEGSVAQILDLGCGSGAIAITLALERPSARITGVEREPDALRTAKSNALLLGARLEWLESDWYSALPGRRFELIVSNPPYIAALDPHLLQGDLRFEPKGALTDGADGKSALRTIASQAPLHLHPGGTLLLEHGYNQAPWLRTLLSEIGYQGVQSWRDLAGHERVTGARWMGSLGS